MRQFVFFCSLFVLAACSIYPEGEDKESWDARINANIDKVRKNDVTIKVPVTPELRGKPLKLKVDQLRQSISLGTALQAWRIQQCWTGGADDAYCNFARENFNYAVTENAMKWNQWEYNENEYNTFDSLMTIDWCANHGFGVRAHCLFWDVDFDVNIPWWVKKKSGDDLISTIHHRIDSAMPELQGKVQHWDVNNEMLHGNWFAENSYDPDIRVKMFQWAQERDPSVQLFVNDYDVLLYQTDEYINHIRDLRDRGAPISGIGIQGHMGPDSIDLGKVEDAGNKIWNAFNLPMWITEFDWNGNNGGDHSQHATELDNFYRLLMSLPGVDGIMMWGFWDQAHWRPEAAIATGDDCHANKAGEAYQNIYNNVLQTHIEVEPKLSQSGEEMEFTFRAFRGEYDIAVVDETGRSLAKLDHEFVVTEDTTFTWSKI